MPERNVYKTLFQILASVCLVALGFVLALILRKSPPPNVGNDPGAAARVEQKFAAADQAKAAGQPAQVQLTPAELNSYLQQNRQSGGPPQSAPTVPIPSSGNAPYGNASVPAASADPNSGALDALASNDPQTIEQVQQSVKDVKVDMDGDLVKAYVVFDFHGKDMSLELDGHLGSKDGYLKFEPVSGKLGSLPLPQSTLEAAVSKMMESPEAREKLKLPNDIKDLTIQDGHAVVSYK
jgi:hypothetical protein